MRVLAIVGLVLVSACSVTDPKEPDLTISLTSDVPLSSSHVFRVEVDGTRYDLPLGSATTRYSMDRTVPRTGSFNVTASLLDGSNPVASASFLQVFERDRDHWVSAIIALQRPVGHCFGTMIALPYLTTSAAADSVFLMYGSIPKDAVC